MKVILLQEIKGQGGEGDVVEVKRGYAVNYLFPQNMAMEATKGNLKQLELRKHNIAKRESERLDSADKIQAALADKKLVIAARVGEEGQLFGSVTTQQIAEKMNEELGLEIDRKKIDLHAPIKTAGEHKVTVSIYREIKAVLTVEVVDENVDEDELAEQAAKEAVAVAVAADVVEAKELDEDAEALGLADKINETIDATEVDAKVAKIAREADAAAKEVANKLAEAADAEEGGDESPEELADAATQVLQEAEAVIDAAADAAADEARED